MLMTLWPKPAKAGPPQNPSFAPSLAVPYTSYAFHRPQQDVTTSNTTMAGQVGNIKVDSPTHVTDRQTKNCSSVFTDLATCPHDDTRLEQPEVALAHHRGQTLPTLMTNKVRPNLAFRNNKFHNKPLPRQFHSCFFPDTTKKLGSTPHTNCGKCKTSASRTNTRAVPQNRIGNTAASRDAAAAPGSRQSAAVPGLSVGITSCITAIMREHRCTSISTAKEALPCTQ